MSGYVENIGPLKVKCLEIAYDIVEKSEIPKQDPNKTAEIIIKVMKRLISEVQ